MANGNSTMSNAFKFIGLLITVLGLMFVVGKTVERFEAQGASIAHIDAVKADKISVEVNREKVNLLMSTKVDKDVYNQHVENDEKKFNLILDVINRRFDELQQQIRNRP